MVDNIQIKLIDTPGLIDTSRSAESIMTELAKVSFDLNTDLSDQSISDVDNMCETVLSCI